jgi:hypothetical protein
MNDDPVASLLASPQVTSNKGSSRQVIGWVAWASVELRDYVDIGGWGGAVEKGHGWNDYIASANQKYLLYYEALRAAIIERGLRRGGDWHQQGRDGVPVFDDGVIATFSFRGWGDLMAAIWADADGRRFGYMDYYMDCCLQDAGIEPSPPIEARE